MSAVLSAKVMQRYAIKNNKLFISTKGNGFEIDEIEIIEPYTSNEPNNYQNKYRIFLTNHSVIKIDEIEFKELNDKMKSS